MNCSMNLPYSLLNNETTKLITKEKILIILENIKAKAK